MKQNPAPHQQSLRPLVARKVPAITGRWHRNFNRRTSGIEVLESRIAPASLAMLDETGSVTILGDQGGPGEIESLTVSIIGVNLHFTDASNGITAGGGFTQNGANDVFLALSELTANLTVNTGTGADTLAFSSDLTLSGDTTLTSGDVTFNNSIALATDKTLSTTATGTISLASAIADLSATGTGAISLTTARNIVLVGGSSLTTVDGNLDLSANLQAIPTSGDFSGVFLNNGLIQITGAGSISVSGRGGDGTAVAQNGVQVAFGGDIIGGTTGSVTIQGTGGVPNMNAINFGVIVNEVGSSVTSGGGNVDVTGIGGYGVTVISDGLITSGGDGAVTVTGIGNDDSSIGVYVAINSVITSGGNGAVTVDGTASGNGCYGFYVSDTSVVTSGGTGSVTVTGTAGAGTANLGVDVINGGSITSGGGSVSVTGIATADNFAVRIESGGTISSGGGAGIIITADSLDIPSGSISSGPGQTTIATRTPGTLIDLGGADVLSGDPLTLGLTDAELDQVTAGILQIGGNNTGSLTVSAEITHGSQFSLNSEGDVSGLGGIALAVGKNLTIHSGNIVALGGVLTVSGTLSILPSQETMGNVTLTNAGNAFETVTVEAANSVSLRDDSGFNLGPISINNLLTVESAGLITQSDPLSADSLTKLGVGTLILSASNSYGGTTTIGAGTIEVAASGSLPVSPLVLNGGSIFYNTGGSESGGDVTLNANSTVQVGANTSVFWTGNLIGPGRTLTKTGPGILSHGNDPSPLVTIAGVSVSEGAIVNFASGGFGTGPIDIAPGAALWVDTIEGQAVTMSNAITFRGGAGESVVFGGLTIPGALVLRSGGGGDGIFTGSLTLIGNNTINTEGGGIIFAGRDVRAPGIVRPPINTEGGGIIFAGVVSGAGTFTKISANTLTLGSRLNTFGSASAITVEAGILKIGLDAGFPGVTAASNGMLGDLGNSLVFSGGNLAVTNGFITTRHFTRTVDTNIDIAAGTLKLTGTVDGTGVITQTGAGSLAFGENFTGATVVNTETGPVAVGAAKFALEGEGSAVITIVSDGLGGKKIEEIALTGTTAATEIEIKGPTTAGATLVVESITSTDPEPEIASITLRKGVILGDGVADDVPDINIAGKIGKLTVDTVMPNTIIRLGYGLTYDNLGDETTPDTYNNHPDVVIKSITGPGVIIDVTGDGQPAGTGGGGLGKVVISSWIGAGTIRTTQGIGSFTLRTGDCNVVFEVDADHRGELTTANVGKMVIQNGSWGSSGNEIEGNVGSFSAVGFLAGATFTAGSFTKFTVKTGTFAGTATFTKPDATEVGTISVGSDFLGNITSAASIKNVNVKGEFKGSLVAQSIGSITAFLFNGTKPTDAGDYGSENRHNIVALNGSLGTLKTKSGGIAHYDIYAATLAGGIAVKALSGPGVDDVTFDAAQILSITSNLPIVDSVFAARDRIGKISIGDKINFSGATNAKFLSGVNLGGDGVLAGAVADTYTLAATIGRITIKGAMAQTVISAGFTPGTDLIWGNADDIAALTGVIPILPLKVIDAIALATVLGETTNDPVSNTIQAASFKGIKVDALAILLAGFPKDVATGQTGTADDIRFRIV